MPTPSLFQRLKERKLVQWALAYLAGAWVVLQALDALETPLGLTATIQRAILVVVIAGFFITLVLAWYHGEKGRQRVSGPEFLVVVILLVIAGIGISLVGGDPGTGGDGPGGWRDDRPTVAVLPMDNLSPNPAHDFFSAGVQEDLTAKLQRIPTLAVISRTSVERYRDPSNRPSIREIADDLGADYLLEGSARIGGDSVRITVQLIDGESDVHLWAGDFDAPYSVDDYVRIQSEIVQRIASDLRATVSPEDRVWLEAIPTRSLEALEAYMRGNEAFLQERLRGQYTGSSPSGDLFQQAVDLDPLFSNAYARLALSLSYTSPNDQRLERTRVAAERALALQPGTSAGELALGRYFLGLGDAEEAMRRFHLAENADPNFASAAYEIGELQRRLGEYDAAIASFRRAVKLDPLNSVSQRALVWSLLFAHRFQDALDANVKIQAMDPSTVSTLDRAWIYFTMGEEEQARTTVAPVLASDGRPFNAIPGSPWGVVLRVLTEAEREAAFDNFRQIFERDCQAWGFCLRKAMNLEARGDFERAQVYWDSVRVLFEANPPQAWVGLAASTHAFTALGLKEEAIKTAKALVELEGADQPGFVEDRFYWNPAARAVLARTYAQFGEFDLALDLLEELAPAPSWLSVHLLGLDPWWDPLRDHPRFQALLEEYRDDVEY